MISNKPITKKILLFIASIFVFSIVNTNAQDGKALFNANCASCHNVFKAATGPALGGLEGRGPWSDRNKIYEWIKNPSAFMAKDPYTAGLKTQYGSVMNAIPSLAPKEIDAIVTYINKAYTDGPGGPTPPGGNNPAADDSGNKNWIIFGILSLVLAIIALILMQVNSNLKKLSDDKEGILRPEPVPVYRNKVYLAMASMLFFIIGGFFVTKGAVGLGRQKDYQPEQPIYYSHKVHAGINQISCLYCHGNAFESKSATVPSVNVCMNCHKNIQTYEKGPELTDANGTKINGTQEIAKLYKYAGFDPKNANAWDPSMIKNAVPWVKIHSLPDHVYFNHSQHTKAGKVQCQSCHGNIQEMDEVKQFAELSMGWCINCHRQSNVNFNYSDSSGGNKFYSIYEKFHNDFKSGKMDSIKVKDIGGLECQKCHY
jgi:cytochrome c553